MCMAVTIVTVRYTCSPGRNQSRTPRNTRKDSLIGETCPSCRPPDLLMSRLFSPSLPNIYNCIHTSADGRDNWPVTSVDAIGGFGGLISSTAVDGSKERHAAVGSGDTRLRPADGSARWKLHTRPSVAFGFLSIGQADACCSHCVSDLSEANQPAKSRPAALKNPTAGCCTIESNRRSE